MYQILNKAMALDISVKEAKKLIRLKYEKERQAKVRKPSKWYKKIGWRGTLEYYKWRQAVLKRDNWTCMNNECRTKKGKFCGHHLLPSKDLRYDVDNGVCLCQKCHDAFHRGDLIIYF